MTETNQPLAPHLLASIDVSRAGRHCKMRLGDLNGDGRMEMLLAQSDGGIDNRYVPHQVQCLTAYDLDGKLLWQVGTPDVPEPGRPGSDYPVQIFDIDGDGQLEVLCVMEKEFRILEGKTGKIKKSWALPHEEAHDCIAVANLRGLDAPQDILLKDRYHQMWALDADGNVLWTHEGNVGHFPWVFDLDQDGKDEVMAGYDLLDHDGTKLWSCQNLKDHADCIWMGSVTGEKPNDIQIVVGGSVTVMYDRHGQELWRYDGSIESQHISLGKFRDDLPGLQIAGLDRIVRGGPTGGKDGMFLLDRDGQEVWKEDRQTPGWLTIIETLSNWDDQPLDYILAFRRGGGITPTLYDGRMNAAYRFPVDGYVAYADLIGSGKQQVIIYDHQTASVFGAEKIDLSSSLSDRALPQTKRLYNATLYPGGEYMD